MNCTLHESLCTRRNPSILTLFSTNMDEEPSWVKELQAKAAKVEMGQNNVDAKLDKISKQTEEIWRGAREDMGQLREFMEKLGEEMKRGLESYREETNKKFETVDVEMREQRKDIELLEQHVMEGEEWSTEVHDIIKISLEQQRKLQEKVTDFEGRTRRNIVRIWGLKEGIEGDSVQEYVDKLIHRELGLAEDVKLEIQRAHRALALKPPPNKPPRAIIVNCLRFDIKESILRSAWIKEVKVDGQRVTVDQDYAAEVVAKRRKYAGLKRILKENGIRFQSPMDTLRVHWPEGIRVYHTTLSTQRVSKTQRHRRELSHNYTLKLNIMANVTLFCS
uniref:L1 transposable element RRM domain-containing protein n=1 Tax=Stegastes partitus TaxID=144197 RepID=A0A3B5AS13_9TELE